jgi:phage terminase small subunit
MKTKLTLKQEAFCQAYIETGNASEAYRRAYDAGNMAAETIHRKAKEVLDNGKVAARIEALRKKIEKRHDLTVDELIAELEEARQVALKAPTPQAAAAIAGTMGKAKLLGHDKTIISGDPDKPILQKIAVSFVAANGQK